MEEKICKNCIYWGAEEEFASSSDCFHSEPLKLGAKGIIIHCTKWNETCDYFRSVAQ